MRRVGTGPRRRTAPCSGPPPTAPAPSSRTPADGIREVRLRAELVWIALLCECDCREGTHSRHPPTPFRRQPSAGARSFPRGVNRINDLPHDVVMRGDASDQFLGTTGRRFELLIHVIRQQRAQIRACDARGGPLFVHLSPGTDAPPGTPDRHERMQDQGVGGPRPGFPAPRRWHTVLVPSTSAMDETVEATARRTLWCGSSLKEDRNIEVTLVLPHPDVPLRLAAPDDLSAPGGPEERVPDRQCPGWCLVSRHSSGLSRDTFTAQRRGVGCRWRGWWSPRSGSGTHEGRGRPGLRGLAPVGPRARPPVRCRRGIRPRATIAPADRSPPAPSG